MKFLFYISTLLTAISTFSQEAKLEFGFDEIRIGEQIPMTLSLTYANPNGDKLVGWPKFNDDFTEEIEIIDRTVDFDEIIDSTNGIYLKKQEFQITSFAPGLHKILPIPIEVNDSVFYTTNTYLRVNSVEIDTSKSIVDIKPNYAVDYSFGEKVEDWFRSYWRWLAGIGVAIAAFFIYRLWKNRKPQEEEVPYVPTIPAHITALKSLKELEREEAWQSSEQKEYYTDLTYTVRLYLEQRFGIKAVEQTTREIITELRYADISEEDKLHLRKLLSQADMIKFAKMKADSNTGKASLYKSIDFVEKTKKIEETEGDEEDA
ncbi:MAG: hypothetical protein BM555_01635 [Crocinitomix sp. MedPE-SWsnd]|nr:MAG: hypothetical protein BM555_01635 [Crocinitomix sp. MedPE-SWsnd]